MTTQVRHEAAAAAGAACPAAAFHLRFRSLFDDEKEATFPCDAAGRVAMDALSERDRTSYLFARAMVGRLYAAPQLVAAWHVETSVA